MGAVTLGFDVSPTKLAAGVVMPDGSPAFCCYQPFDGSPEYLRDFVGALDFRLRVDQLEPTLAAVEEPVALRQGQLAAGVVIGMLTYSLYARWPHLELHLRNVSAWRSKVGITAAPKALDEKARRAWYKARAIDEATALGFELPLVGKRVLRPSDDAAEAALIARAIWLEAATYGKDAA